MCHVLVIEDEPFAAMMIEDTLLSAGASSVEIAMTEAEAIDAARRRPPALITSDVRLLEGTGPTAVAAIRDDHGAVPVIFLTATPGDCDECLYATAILAKPVDGQKLKSVLRPLIAAAC